MLELLDVTKTFARIDRPGRRLDALREVTLGVQPGQFVAVRGPSGSGKTTLLLTAAGMLAPDAGKVRLAGQDVYTMSVEERSALRARVVGFVFQQFHLVSYLSVRDNILVPALTTEMPDASDRAEALIERFGLSDRAAHKPSELSIGQRQRTALARALLTDPPLVLADEPTGNLDGANAAEVLEALAQFAADGRAVLLVTHDPAASRYAHRTVELEAGRVCDPSPAITGD